MGITRISLKAPSQLPAALAKHEKAVTAAIRKAMIETAMFGLTAVQQTIRQTAPKPIAAGDYMRSWAVLKTRTGAVLGSSVLHSIFVEIGRRPGKRPPVSVIEEWLRERKIKVAVPKPSKSKKGLKAKKLPPIKERRAKARRAAAFAIAAKIGRDGTEGRYVLRRTMPTIQARALKETRAAVMAALKSAGANAP
jgi:hypothetical protein